MAPLRDDCVQLDQKRASLEDVPERIVTSASATARVFRVDTDEVALFRLKDGSVLNFLWPEKLRKVGFIPLNSHDSLAAHTVRENRAFLNNVASARHAGVFEVVHHDKVKGRPMPILKILSAPLVKDDDRLVRSRSRARERGGRRTSLSSLPGN